MMERFVFADENGELIDVRIDGLSKALAKRAARAIAIFLSDDPVSPIEDFSLMKVILGVPSPDARAAVRQLANDYGATSVNVTTSLRSHRHAA